MARRYAVGKLKAGALSRKGNSSATMLIERVMASRKKLSAVVLSFLLSLSLLSPSSRFCVDECHSKEKVEANSHACCSSQMAFKPEITAKADCECSIHAHQVDAWEPNFSLNFFASETWKTLGSDFSSSMAVVPSFLETALRVFPRFSTLHGQGILLLNSNLRI